MSTLMRCLGLVVSLAVSSFATDVDPILIGSWPGFRQTDPVRALVVSGNYAYLAVDGLQVIDLSNPANPRRVGGINFGSSGATPIDLAISGNHAFLADTESRVRIIDISAPAHPRQVGEYLAGGAILDLAASDKFVCVAIRDSALELIDTSDPLKPRRLSQYSGNGFPTSVVLSGKYVYLVTDRAEFQTLDISDPVTPKPLGRIDGVGSESLALSGRYVFTADTLTVWAIDVSDPASPRLRGNFDAGNGFSMAFSGKYGYFTAGNRVEVFDITDPGNPIRTRGFETRGAHEIALSGDRAYVAGSFSSFPGVPHGSELEIIDISNPLEPFSIGEYDLSGRAQGIVISGNHAFVAYGIGGLRIFDISNPGSPQLVGRLGNIGDVFAVSISGHRASLADRGSWNGQHYLGAVRIIDISDLSQPRETGRFEFKSYLSGLSAAGNLVYLAESANLVCARNRCDWVSASTLRVLDISDPARPHQIASIDSNNWPDHLPASPKYSYTPDPHELWTITDITDSGNPKFVGGYKSIAAAFGISVSNLHSYVPYQNGYGFGVFDISNPANPKIVGSLGTYESGPHLVYSGDRIYLSERRLLQVIDVSNPANPTRIGAYLGREISGVAVAGNHAFVTSPTGVLTLDVTAPANPQRFAVLPTSSWWSNALPTSMNFIYQPDPNEGWLVHDASNPAAPKLIGGYKTIASVNRAIVSGNLACVLHRTNTTQNDLIAIADISNPAIPVQVGAYVPEGVYPNLTVSGSRLVIGASGNYQNNALVRAGIEVVDISNPAAPKRLSYSRTNSPIYTVALKDDLAFAAAGPEGLLILDLSDPANPQKKASLSIESSVDDLALSGNRVYMTGGRNLQIVDVSNPLDPRFLGKYSTGDGFTTVALAGEYVVLSVLEEGLIEVVDVDDPAQPRRICGNSSMAFPYRIRISQGRIFLPGQEDDLYVLDLLPLFKSVERANGQLCLRWKPWNGAILQRSIRLPADAWLDVPGSNLTGEMRFPVQSAPEFFRLKKL